MSLLDRFNAWDRRRAQVEAACIEARDRGFGKAEVRHLRRTSHYLARTYPLFNAAWHAEVVLNQMIAERARRLARMSTPPRR